MAVPADTPRPVPVEVSAFKLYRSWDLRWREAKRTWNSESLEHDYLEVRPVETVYEHDCENNVEFSKRMHSMHANLSDTLKRIPSGITEVAYDLLKPNVTMEGDLGLQPVQKQTASLTNFACWREVFTTKRTKLSQVQSFCASDWLNEWINEWINVLKLMKDEWLILDERGKSFRNRSL